MYRNIPDQDRRGHHSIMEAEDFEFVNPTQQISEMLIQAEVMFKRDYLRLAGFPIDNQLGHKVLVQAARAAWNQRHKHLRSLEIPQSLMCLLDATSKKEQVKLLKGLALKHDQFLAFLIRAGEDHGFVYSQYRAEHLPKGMDSGKLPTLAEVAEDGEVTVIGKTEMTQGQIKQSVQQRHATVAKFLDRSEAWHCFFLTYKSIGGEESYKNGQPHMHYISNAWSLERQYVVEQLKSKNYKLPSLPHIDYERRPKS